LQCARIEADTGFPRLSAVKDEAPMYFLETTASWPVEARYRLLCGQIKQRGDYSTPTASRDGSGVLPKGELTPEEAEVMLSDPFLGWPATALKRNPAKPGVVVSYPGFNQQIVTKEVDADKVNAFKRELQRNTAGGFPLNKKALRAEVTAAMLPRFGKPTKDGGGTWFYKTTLAETVVETCVDFGGRRQVGYFQRLYELMPRPQQRSEPIFSSNGIRSLLGGGGTTDWRYLTDGDIPATAQMIARLCWEFVEAVPGIIERARQIDEEELH